MTESQDRCQWCRRPVEQQPQGRKRRFCRQSCRQRAYESRLVQNRLGLSDQELVITRQNLEGLLDQIYVLQAAIQDVDRDLASTDEPKEVQRALDWLLSAARPVTTTELL